MLILGINEGTDASVVLSNNGRTIFAVQEERLNRQKGFIGFPSQALAFCLKAYNLDAKSLHSICFSNLSSPPGETRADFLRYYVHNARSLMALATSGDASGLSRRLVGLLPEFMQLSVVRWRRAHRAGKINQLVERQLSRFGLDGVKISRFHHHSNHAASAYYGLRKNLHEPHLVLTLDGGGDDACSHMYLGQAGGLQLLAVTPTGHSLGNIYACATFMMGMRPHEHEYKLMGLAPYPDSQYVQELVQKFRGYLDLDPDNPLRFKRKIPEHTSMIVPRLQRDFRFVRFDNLAAALQAFTEELIIRWALAAIEKTGVHNLLAAGGVFMNVKANKRLAELPSVGYFDVFPSCGDETLPFGAVWQCHIHDGGSAEDIRFDDIYLGPDAGADLLEAREKYQDAVVFEYVEDPEITAAELLAAGQIIARCTGKLEFGARALGNRSILADPSRQHLVREINQVIKQRDFWMPFAPAITAEKIGEYVKIPPSLLHARISPYMMHTFDTTERRGELVAGVHNADGTARAQVVWQHLNPRFHKLISHFGYLTGRWVVLNTSFNLHGHPIVTGTCEAIDVMLQSSLKYLVVDNWLITKRNGASPS